FRLNGKVKNVFPYGSGHINDSYKVLTTEQNYLLQRVNQEVFKDIRRLTSNMIRVTGYLTDLISDNNPDERKVLNTIRAQNGNYFYTDDEFDCWRVFDFIEESQSYDRAVNTGLAYEGGKTYGWFIKMLDQFPADSLAETIPRFHDIQFRIENFRNAVKKDAAGRVGVVQKEIDFVEKRAEEITLIHNLGKDGKIPLRVTHNDTKINNVLFNVDNKGICVIDLDTVMPGYVHFDFGDAIRTFTNTADEDEKDLRKVSMDVDLFTAFSEGFLSETKEILNETEISTLAFSAKLMTFIIGLRFLTDYLEGDIYYKTKYPEHNITRARVQFKLVESMEEQFAEMENVVRKLT
ncbi:MAG: aminoglycoside phosphotransferase family protein, partial [Bacteroidales bacterium]|nr:aminoglycoside phosphotransferase family protein [Bacteroidales bacterium]